MAVEVLYFDRTYPVRVYSEYESRKLSDYYNLYTVPKLAVPRKIKSENLTFTRPDLTIFGFDWRALTIESGVHTL